MAKKNIIKHNWPKYLLQWGTLGAIILFLTGLIKTEIPADPETYCPMGGLQAFTTYLVRGSLPCSMSSVQIMMGLAMAAAVVLFSKLFCGYVCPVGTIEDLLGKFRRAIRLKNINISNRSVADRILRIFKYALLFWIFYSTATASELFCKNLDPYYAIATGFKGEITLWMSITTIVLVVLGGLLVDNFWCRYICPLGAISNTFKFWVWVLVLAVLYIALGYIGVAVPWWLLLGILCLMGYCLEIFSGKPKFQLLNVYRNESSCNHCGVCKKECPYHINIAEGGPRLESVDCTLCGDCVAACSKNALYIGARPHSSNRCFRVVLPALLTIAVAVGAFFIGKKYELPTINEQWGIYSKDSLHTQLVDPAILEECTLEGLKQIHCFGSSMAFKGKLEKMSGIYGVKTYVRSHKAVILFDPAKTNKQKIEEEIYVPSHFKCYTPDYKTTPELKVLVIRTEHMSASSDVNMLGLQFKQADSLIYGVDSQWDCPLIVRMYVDPAFDKDEEWIKSIVEKPTFDFVRADGSVKSTPLGFEFVRMEPKKTEFIPTTEFLSRMFTNPFTAEFESRIDAAEGKLQYMYEIADENFTKPLISRGMCFVSNHLSSHKGIIGVYTALNEDYVPSLQIRFCEPMTADEIWNLLTMPEWTITYSADDVRTQPARIIFKKPGRVFPYTGGRYYNKPEE